jgi:hypothetical protein
MGGQFSMANTGRVRRKPDGGLERAQSERAVQSVFRSDFCRHHMSGTSAAIPAASSKVKGALEVPTPFAAISGHVILPPDRFFNVHILDTETHPGTLFVRHRKSGPENLRKSCVRAGKEWWATAWRPSQGYRQTMAFALRPILSGL